MVTKKEIKFYAITSITQATEKDSLYALKSPTDTTFKLIVTDLYGNIVHLKDLTGGSSSSGIINIVSNDNSIDVSGTSTAKNIQVSEVLQNLITSALQPNANITELFNDAGYITISDIPVFTPSDYDLSDFTNTNADPFIKESDLPATYPPSSHTHVEADITDLDKYTQLEVDNLLDNKVDKIAGKGLSEEDYTSTEKSKLSGIEVGAEVNNISDTNATDLTDGGETNLHNHDSRYYTETEVDTFLNNKFNNPTGDNTQYLDGSGIPTTFPTIPSIAGLATETYVNNGLNLKVDKVTGKSLINDTEISRLASMTAIFTTALKSAYDSAGTNLSALLATGSRLITTTEITILSNTSGTNSGDNATNTTSNTYADGKVENNLSASTTVAPSKTAVNDALLQKVDKSYFEDWTDFSGTTVVTSWSVPSITFLQYTRSGKALTIRGRITGTSNTSTNPTITIPFNIANLGAGQSNYSFNYANNNASSISPGCAVGIDNSNIITFFRDGTFLTSWSSTGTKTISFIATFIIQ